METGGHARIMRKTAFEVYGPLCQNHIGGLEVDPFYARKFLPATLIEAIYVINLAHPFQQLRSHLFKSTFYCIRSRFSKDVVTADGMFVI